MSANYFLDSNIFIYSFDQEAPEKQKISLELIQQALTRQSGCISYQVIQEVLNVLSKKFTRKLNVDDTRLFLNEVLMPIQKVNPSQLLYQSAINIQQRWQFSFYDSLIIAGAIEAECDVLYSEDLQHQQKVGSVEIINPYI